MARFPQLVSLLLNSLLHANQLSNSQDLPVDTPLGLEPNDGPVPTAGESIALNSLLHANQPLHVSIRK